MFFVLFVMHDSSKLDAVLSAWEQAGVKGITILPSTGMVRIKNHRKALREDIPLIPRLEDFLRHTENTNRTLFTIVNTEAEADQVISATESVVGDLDLPHTGIIAVLPIYKVKGLDRLPGNE